MILFNVYSFDWECPQLLFQTFDRTKAETFVNSGNLTNGLVDNYYHSFFFTETNLDNIEAEADNYLSKCSKKLILTIKEEENTNSRELISSEIKLLHDNDSCSKCDRYSDCSIYEICLSSLTVPDNLFSDEINAEIDNINKEIKN